VTHEYVDEPQAPQPHVPRHDRHRRRPAPAAAAAATAGPAPAAAARRAGAPRARLGGLAKGEARDCVEAAVADKECLCLGAPGGDREQRVERGRRGGRAGAGAADDELRGAQARPGGSVTEGHDCGWGAP
jgi:hypothetical protein